MKIFTKCILLTLGIINLSICYTSDLSKENEDCIFLPHINQKFTSQQFIDWLREQNKILSLASDPNFASMISAKVYMANIRYREADSHKILSKSKITTIEFNLQNAQLFSREDFDSMIAETPSDNEYLIESIISFLKKDFDSLSYQFQSLLNNMSSLVVFSDVTSKLYKDKFPENYQFFVENKVKNHASKKTKEVEKRFRKIIKDLYEGEYTERWRLSLLKRLLYLHPDIMNEEYRKMPSILKDNILQKKTVFNFNSKPYEINCLASDDPMNLIAGLITSCCMNLDNEGKIYCILASHMKNAGMLFISKNNKPVANSFVTLLTTNPSGNKNRRALVINCIVFNKEISPNTISYALSKHFSDEPFDIYYGLAYNYGIGGILKPRHYTPAVDETYIISEQFLEKDFIDLVRLYPPIKVVLNNKGLQDPLQSVDFMGGIGRLDFSKQISTNT